MGLKDLEIPFKIYICIKDRFKIFKDKGAAKKLCFFPPLPSLDDCAGLSGASCSLSPRSALRLSQRPIRSGSLPSLLSAQRPPPLWPSAFSHPLDLGSHDLDETPKAVF